MRLEVKRVMLEMTQIMKRTVKMNRKVSGNKENKENTEAAIMMIKGNHKNDTYDEEKC